LFLLFCKTYILARLTGNDTSNDKQTVEGLVTGEQQSPIATLPTEIPVWIHMCVE